MKLSAVMATKEEERNIRDCLESVKWADEIVVMEKKASCHIKYSGVKNAYARYA